MYQTFGAFTETHESIAAFRIQHLRASVLENRTFLTEIGDLYNLVKFFYLNTLPGDVKIEPTATPPTGDAIKKDQSILKTNKDKGLLSLLKFKKKPDKTALPTSFLKKNGKTVSILMSSNTGFYGGILKNLFDGFMNYVSTNKTDLAIIGRLGREFYNERLKTDNTIPKTFAYFDLDDEHPTDQQMDKIINFAKDYDGIVVHNIQFFSVLTQIPYYSNIAGEVGLVGQADKDTSFIFEPSYEEILTFFETQILEAVFRQKVYEHQLARYGGKLVAMDDAVTSSKDEVKKLERRRLRLKKQVLNKKQQEVFSALLGSYQEY